jgi:hypothetical protein
MASVTLRRNARLSWASAGFCFFGAVDRAVEGRYAWAIGYAIITLLNVLLAREIER